MFWDMALVLNPAMQEASAASTQGNSSLPGTLAKSELRETHGNVTYLGKVRPPNSESDLWGFSKSLQRLVG